MFAYGPADATASQNPTVSRGSFKSRLVVPFWYRLTLVVLERGRVDECGVKLNDCHCEIGQMKTTRARSSAAQLGKAY